MNNPGSIASSAWGVLVLLSFPALNTHLTISWISTAIQRSTPTGPGSWKPREWSHLRSHRGKPVFLEEGCVLTALQASGIKSEELCVRTRKSGVSTPRAAYRNLTTGQFSDIRGPALDGVAPDKRVSVNSLEIYLVTNTIPLNLPLASLVTVRPCFFLIKLKQLALFSLQLEGIDWAYKCGWDLGPRWYD